MTPRLVVLREEAKKAGIDLKLKLLDSSSAFKSFLEKKHEIAYMSGQLASDHNTGEDSQEKMLIKLRQITYQILMIKN